MGGQTGQPLVVNPIVIDLKHAFDLQRTVTSHGWARLAPFRWSSDTETLSHADAIDGRIVTWTVRQSGPLRLSIDVDVPSDDALVEEVETRVHRSLMLAWNPSEAVATAQRIDPDVAQDVETGGGRLLRGTTFFEDVYKTICTINTSWANTVRLTDAISTHFGRGSAPTPAEIVDSGIAALDKVKMGYRKDVLYRMTQDLLDSGKMDSDGNLTGDGLTRDELLGFKGIGPYAADHLRVLQGDYERIPVDSEVRSYLGLVKGSGQAEAHSRFSQWGKYRFLGYKAGRLINRH